MNPSKILVRNLIDFGLISLLELKGASEFKCFVSVIDATIAGQNTCAVASAVATTILYFVLLSCFFLTGFFSFFLKSLSKDHLPLLIRC
jgi:hypothetical protein